MVGIVSGSGLGLFNTSLDTLGFSGGQNGLGQAGGAAYVNLATGNLAVQFADETMSGTGADLLALRTYNSTGTISDGDGDAWRWSGEKRIELVSGSRGSSGTVKRIAGDGSQITYTWSSSYGGYVSTAGSGAHDVIKWNGSTTEWEFRQDNNSESVEYYNGSTGWIKRLKDTSGNQINYTFSGNKLTKIVDQISGQTIQFVYGTSGNGNGKVVGVNTRLTATGAQTRQVNYEYDAYGRLSKVKTDLSENGSMSDGKIYTTTYTYQNTSSKRIASISQSDGTKVNFTYDSSNRIRTVTDQTGVTTFTYSGGSTAVKNGDGKTWTYTFDSSKRLTKVSSPSVNGVVQSTTYTYASNGDLTSVKDGKGKAITYTHDSRGNRTKEVDSLGNTVKRTFSGSNQVLTETRYSVASTSSPSGAETVRYVYDSKGRLIFTVSAVGRVSELTYNSRGLVEKMIQYAGKTYSVGSLGQTATISASQMTSWKNGLTTTQKSKSQLTLLNYDAKGNLSKKTEYATVNTSGNGVLNNAATVTEYVYSEHGQLLQTIAVRGSSRTAKTTLSSVVYDGMGRITSRVSAGASITTTYSGAQVTVKNTASGLTVVSATDSRGRITSVTQSGSGESRITKFVYDSAGRLRMTQDPTGARSYKFYDAASRLSAVVDAEGSAVVYSYDANGKLLTQTAYAKKANTSSWFNSSNNTVTVSALTVGTSGTHVITDSANDRKTTYTYDNSGRLKTTAVTGGLSTITNTYDGASRLTKVTQGSRVTQYYYDKDGRQIGSLDAEKYLSENIYDSAGRLVEVRRYGTKVSTVTSFSSMKSAVGSGSKLSTFIYYDSQGRKVGSVDEKGFLTETIYDQANNNRKNVSYMKAITVSASDTLSTAKSKAGTNKRTTTTVFDGYGRLATETRHDGTRSRNVYDSAGRLVRVIEAESTADLRATRKRYNAFGEVTGVVSGVGDSTLSSSASSSQINTAITNYGKTYQYDGAGRKITELGASVSGKPRAKAFYFYNDAGQLTYTVNALGEVSKTTYNAFGQVSQVRLYSNRLSSSNLSSITKGGHESLVSGKVVANSSKDSVIKTEYNRLGLVSKTTDAENFVTTNTYTGYGQLHYSTRTIASGNTVRSRTTYDLLGRVKEQYGDYDGIRAQTSSRYDGFGRITQTIDANRKTTTYTYGSNGRVITVKNPVGYTTKTEVDAFGRTIKSYDGYNKLTQFVYDDTNRKLTVIHPDNTKIITIKTRTGEVLQITDARNNTIKYTYTKDGLLDTVVDGSGKKIVDNKYERSGRLYESVDGNGVVTRYTYDAANRATLKQVDPTGLNLRTSYQFDGQGRQIKVTEGYGTSEAKVTQYNYDRKNQVRQIIVDPAGLKLSTRFTYDGQGNTVKVERGTTASPAQQTTTYTFDKLGRKTQEVIGGVNITTKYRYDKNGNLTRVIDPNGNSTWFIYNNAGYRTHSIDAQGGVTTYAYDKNGKVYHERQYANALSSSTLTSLNSNNAPTSVSLPSTSSADRRMYNVYDVNGRLVYNLQAKDSSNWVVSESRYDANGNVTKLIAYDKTISESSINAVASGSSSSGGLITTSEVSNILSSLGYSSTSFGSARVTSYVYDKNNRQTKTTLAGWYDKTDGKVYNSKSGQSDRFQRTIEVAYDAVGNAISNKIKTGTGSSDYIYQYRAYDKAGREIFDVDGLGNVSNKAYFATGEIKSVTRYASGVGVKTSGSWTESALRAHSAIKSTNRRTISFTYDKAGRELTVSQPTGGLTTKKYDAFGNVIHLKQKLTSTVNAETFYYYDKANRKVLEIDAEKYATKTEYDAVGNVKKVREYAKKYTGSLSTSTQPTSFTTNSKDRITQYNYDSLGRNTTVYRALYDNTTSLRKVSESVYNRFDEVTKSYDEKRNLTQVSYDRLGNVTQVKEPARVIAGTGTDVFKSTVNATPITNITYNAFGEVTREVRSTSGGLGASITLDYQYDLAGNETASKDGNGRWTYYSYDVSGKVIKQKLSVSVTSAPATIDYSHTLERRYTYDKAGRQIATVDVYDGKQTGQYNVYNAFGEVIQERKIWGSSGSSVTTLKNTSSKNVLVAAYSYKTNGQLNYKRSSSGYVFYTFDYANRITKVIQRETTSANSSTDRVTENIYDKLGRVTQRKLPKFGSTNSFGSTSTTVKTPIINLTYDRWGNVLSESGNTVGVTRTYNQDNQLLTEIKSNVNRINFNSTTSSTKVKNKFNYDSLGRLTSQYQYAYNGSSTSYFSSRRVVYNTYNAAGQVTRTMDATSVDTDFVYDVHGNKVGSRDKIGHVTKYTYDKNNQMVGKYLLRIGSTGAYKGSGTPTAIKLATYRYDQAGRKYAEGDYYGNYDYYKYDARGKIVVHRNKAGGEKLFTYDELGHKTAEKLQFSHTYDADPSPYGTNMVTTTTTTPVLSWSYKNSAGTDYLDYKSDLLQKRQVGTDSSQIYTYSYNNRGQLLNEKRNGSVVVTYTYWENGLQKSIKETNTVNSTSTTNTNNFYYDVKGNKTAEYNKTSTSVAAHYETGYGGTQYYVPATSSDTGSFYTYFQYDAQNRLIQVKSPKTTVKIGGGSHSTTALNSLYYHYDEWGNRRRIKGQYGSTTKYEWFSYDKAGRVLIEGGSSNGSAVTRGSGKEYAYDTAGRRAKEYMSQTTKQYRSGPYGEVYLGSSTIRTDRLYSYNDLGLVSLTRIQVKESGYVNSTSTSNENSYTYDNRGFKTKEIQYKKNRTVDNTYSADGTLKTQTTKIKSNGRKESYVYNAYNSYGELSYYTYYAYDTSKSSTPQKFYTTYSYSYKTTYSGRQVGSISVKTSQSGTAAGTTYNSYDSRGRLTSARITESSGNNTGTSYRYFGYNASGQMIGRYEKKYGSSTYKIQNYYYAPGGGELASLGGLGNNISPLSPVSDGGNTPGSYTVNSGDTLMGIATALFGDAKLWYLIADANGLSMGPTDAFSPGDVGRNLKIPNNDKNVSNTSNNWKPYNPTEKIGDLTPDPTILPPPKKKGCGVLAIIIMVVVAVVLTVVTAGVAAAAMGATVASTGATGVFALGGAALTGGLAGGTIAGVAVGGAVASMAAATVGGFVGSLGSQLVGKGLGVVDSISLKKAFASGLTAGFAAGAGAYLQGASWATKTVDGAKKMNMAGNMAQGASSYLGSVAANKIAGMDVSFNWTDLAVATLSSGITGRTGNGITDAAANVGGNFVGNFVGNMWGATVSSSLSRLAGRGGKQDWAAMAADSFGNALGSSIVKTMARNQRANKLLEKAGMPVDRKDHRVSSDFARKLVDSGLKDSEILLVLTEKGIQAGLLDLDVTRSGGISNATASNRAMRFIESRMEQGEAPPVEPTTNPSETGETSSADSTSSPEQGQQEKLKTYTLEEVVVTANPVNGPGGATITEKVFTGGTQVVDGFTNLYLEHPYLATFAFESTKIVVTGGPVKKVVQKIAKSAFGNAIEAAKEEIVSPVRDSVAEFVTSLNLTVDLNISGHEATITSEMFGEVAGEVSASIVETVVFDDGAKEIAGHGTNIKNNITQANMHNAGKGAPRYDRWVNRKGHTVHSNMDGSVTYVRKDGVSVTYKKAPDGNVYPDFTPHLNHPSGVKSVEIDQPFSKNRTSDYKAANEAAGHPEWGSKPPENYRWHHHEDGKTMMLVPDDIHDEFSHYGGVSNSN